MTYALAVYQSLERSDPTVAMTKFRSSAAVERDVKAFREQLGTIKSTDDLFKNRKAMSFVLTAYGLETELNLMGRIKGVMMSDLSNPRSTANVLKDARYREIAGDLQMFKTGLDTLKKTATVDKIVDRYVAAQYELNISKDNPALREARYFAKNIGKVSNVYQILGDNVLRKVVTSTLGLPEQIAIQPIETQAELLKNRLDIKQFQTAAASGAAAVDLRANAQTDIAGLEAAAKALQGAVGQTTEMGTRIRATLARYDGLAALQDPTGPNAATIAVHEVAVPELAKMEGVASAADTAIGRIADALNNLSSLRRLAADPANADNFADYKTQFAAAVDDIRTVIDSGAAYRFEGQDYNLLDGSMSADLSATINEGGATVTLRRQDLTGFLAELDTAAAAFAGASDAGDTAALNETAAAISRSGPMLGNVRDGLISDRSANQTRIDAVPDFLASIDTAAIRRGSLSLSDADSRLRDIGARLTELREVANESMARANGADRGDLQDRARQIVDAINVLIDTPGMGTDNLLGASDTLYTLNAGHSVTIRGRDIAGALDPVLGSANVNNANVAEVLRDAIGATLMPAITKARDDLRVDRQVINLAANVLDARGKIDERARSLVNEVPGIVSRAASGVTNFLNPAQKSLTIKLASATGAVTIDPELTFRQDLTTKLSAAAAQLPGNLAGAGGAYALLSEAADIANASNSRVVAAKAGVDRHLLDARRRLLQAPPAPAATAAAQPTEFTKRFVQRFLALNDMKAAADGSGVSANTPGAAMLGLFA